MNTNREEKLLCHIAMVAKFLDEKKLKHHLKWINSFSNFIDLIQFHLICHMLTKFLSLNLKGPYLRLEKKRWILSCAALLCKVDAWN